ncbi:MAG: hypothetical protein ABR512_12715 [Desulfopila sp.]
MEIRNSQGLNRAYYGDPWEVLMKGKFKVRVAQGIARTPPYFFSKHSKKSGSGFCRELLVGY